MQESQNIQLNPIIEPNPIPFTFDAIGWKILFFIFITTVLLIIYRYYLHYKRNQYRRDAVLKIYEITKLHENSIKDVIKQVMFQIKQTALQTYDRKQVASLEGKLWLEYLDNKVKGVHFLDNEEVIKSAVYKDTYKNERSFNESEFVSMSIKWIKSHA